MLNYAIEVLENTINRQSTTCVIIPTFRSKEVTASTILSLISCNKGTDYDIVLVDNGGFDYEYIKDKANGQGFNNLHYLVLKENVGGAGALHTAQKTCYDSGYEYFILSDNDAELLTKNGIDILIESLQKYDLVLPTNIDNKDMGKTDTELEFYGLIHYLTLSRETIEKLGFLNKEFFLLLDDLDYVARANSLKMKVYMIHKCQYFHPFRKISLFYNLTAYFTIRNHLLFIIKNPNRVALKYKLLSLRYLLLYLVIKTIHIIQLRDISIFKTMFIAFRDFLFENITLNFPENNFRFIRVEPGDWQEKRDFYDISLDKNRVFIKRGYYIKNSKNGEISYFRLQKDDHGA